MNINLSRTIAAALLGSVAAVSFAQSRGGSGNAGTASSPANSSAGANNSPQTNASNAPAANPNSNPNPNPNSSPIVSPNAAAAPNASAAPAANPNSNPNPNPTSSPITNQNSAATGVNPVNNTTSNGITNQATTSNNSPNNSISNATTNGLTNQGTPTNTPSGVPVNTPGNGVTGAQSTVPMTSTELNAAGTTASTPQIFATLDPNHKGYLSTADVAANKYLTDNFAHCDTNSDGRLTQSEVTVCTSGH